MRSRVRREVEQGLTVFDRNSEFLHLPWEGGIGESLMFTWGATFGWNIDFNIGRAVLEACSETWNLGTDSAFALGPRKTTET
jgi:hypothetical protein